MKPNELCSLMSKFNLDAAALANKTGIGKGIIKGWMTYGCSVKDAADIRLALGCEQ